jgi:hypothetical protein
MAGPFKCTSMLVKIDGNTVGVVEGMDMELQWNGGIEHFYGSLTGRHAIGGKKGTYSLRRWFMADTDSDLLFDLFDGKIPFSLSGEIDGLSNSQLSLSNCIAYRYKPRTGSANDIIGEEVSGEAVSWSATIA